MPKKKTDLSNILLKELSLVDGGANQHAHVCIIKRNDAVNKAVTKTEDGKNYTASDYAYIPDAEKPSTWKLRLTDEPGGSPSAKIVGAAVAALGKGFRGQKVEIPMKDLPKVKAKVRSAWKKANPDKETSDMPDAIKKGFFEKIGEDLEGIPSDTFDEIIKMEAALSFNDVLGNEEFNSKAWSMMNALQESVSSILGDDDIDSQEKRGKIQQTLDEFNAAFRVAVGSIIKIGGGKMTPEELEKRLGELEDSLQAKDEKLEKATTDLEAANQQVEELKEKLEKAESDLEAASHSDEESEEEAIDKSKLPSEVQKYLTDLESENKATQERVAKMEDEAETREVVQKVRDDYSNLPGEENAIVKAIKDVRKNCPESMEILDSLLKAGSEALAKNFESKGEDETGDGDAEVTATQKLEGKAKEIAKRDGITEQRAFVKALDEYPELAKQEREERSGATSH
jgi:predicted  nucleic acid-binding Zn-ribbon protein